jgi:hypothetical protein
MVCKHTGKNWKKYIKTSEKREKKSMNMPCLKIQIPEFNLKHVQTQPKKT